MKVLDYVKFSITKYPTLYLFPDFNSSMLRVLDHAFNTIGNGVEWAQTKDPTKAGYLTSNYDSDYQEDYGTVKYEGDFNRYFKEPWVEVSQSYCQSVFEGFKSEFDQHPKKNYWVANSSGVIPYDDFLKSIENFEECPYFFIRKDAIQSNIDHLMEHGGIDHKHYSWKPYPSFNKRHSPFWEEGCAYIQDDWKVAALWFLSESEEYFKDPERVKSYNYGPESAPKALQFIKETQEKLLSL